MGLMQYAALFITCFLVYSLSVAVHADAENATTPFSYDLSAYNGPPNWWRLNFPKWIDCKGRHQSPINLVNGRAIVSPALGDLRRAYKPAPAIVRNRGYDISVIWRGDAGGVIINGTEYKLLACHWHTPSEHTVDGQSFNMEIHMVHNNSLGNISVIGILYKLGRPDPFIEKIISYIKNATREGTNAGVVDPNDIEFTGRGYYRYSGSLTTPPCTEGVLWTVLKKARTASAEQIRALREAVDDGYENNARPTQRSNVTVYKYCPKPQQ